jgi:hypothetical protein
VRVREDEVFAAAPRILKSLKELDASPGLGDCTNIVGGVVMPAVVAPPAAPLTLKSLKDDAAALMLRRIAGLPSRIVPFKPS